MRTSAVCAKPEKKKELELADVDGVSPNEGTGSDLLVSGGDRVTYDGRGGRDIDEDMEFLDVKENPVNPLNVPLPPTGYKMVKNYQLGLHTVLERCISQ